MTGCKFPQHHRAEHGGSVLAVAAPVALVLAVVWIRAHLAELARWAVVVAVVLVAAAAVVLAARFAVRRVRRNVKADISANGLPW